MTNAKDIRVSVRTAELKASADGDDGPATFNGIAVGIGDILHMDDGTPVLFTEEELRKSAETQANEPLSVDHPSDDEGNPLYPPPTDETAGTVPKAGFIEGRGLGYEATTHDENIAKGIQAGSYDVSVHPTFTLGEKDPETGAYVAENVNFQDLSVVSKGDSRSNTVQWGPSQQLAAWAHSTDIGEELDASVDVDDDAPGRSMAQAFVDEFRRLTASADSTTSGDEETEDEPTDDEPAESGVDPDSDINMGDDDTPDDDDQNDAPDGGDDQTNTVTIDIGDHDSFDEYLAEKVNEQVDQATAAKKKGEKVDEIIARSDDYDEDDREDLMASADKMVDREHKRVTGQLTASLPGNVGGRKHAARESGDDDLDAYGTGVGN